MEKIKNFIFKSYSKIKRRWLLIFYIFFILINTSVLSIVHGYYEDGYLIESYTYAINSPFPSSYQGKRWLNTTTTGTFTSGYLQIDNNDNCYIYTENYSFTFISFDFTGHSDDDGVYYIKMTNILKQQLFKIDYTEAGGTAGMDIKDDNDVIIYNDAGVGELGFLNITFNTIDKEVNIVLDGSGVLDNVDETFDTREDLVSYDNFIYIAVSNDAQAYIRLNEVKCYLGSTQYEWEISYNYEGKLTNNGFEFSTQINNNYFEVETDYNNIGGSEYFIKQVAIAMSESTEFTDINLYLKINDIDIGTPNALYHYTNAIPSRFLVVWEDIDISGIDDTLVFEWLAVATSGAPTVSFIGYSGDADNDGDLNFKYSDGNDGLINFDGAYNGIYTYDNDLMYMFWFETTTQHYGGVEDGNYSMCSGEPLNYQRLETSIFSNNRYIEFKWNSALTINVKAFDLYVHNYQYERVSSDLNRYKLVLNGNDCGHPDYWIPYGNNFKLRWTGLDINYQQQEPIIELFSATPFVFGLSQYYWYIGYAEQNNVCPFFYWHGTNELFGNNHIDGTVFYPRGTPAFCMWYQTIDFEPTFVNDSLYIQKDIDGDTTFTTYQNILIHYSLATKGAYSYLQLWKNESGTSTRYTGGKWGGNGLLVTEWTGIESFIANSTMLGNWELNLYRSGENKTEHATFTIISLSQEDTYSWLYTSPNPSDTCTDYILGWLYNKSYWDNRNGVIFRNRADNFETATIVRDNIIGDGTLTDSECSQGNVIYWLCSKDSNDNYYILIKHVHFVGTVFLNELYVLYTDVALSDFYDKRVPQEIWGTHSYYGFDTYITLNGERIRTVTYEPSFDFIFDISGTGTYEVALKTKNALGFTLILDTKMFIIQSDSGDNGILPRVDSLTGAILGTILTLCFTLIPIGLVGGFKLIQFKIDIPPVIYSIFAGTGVCLSALLKFWGWEVPFFIIALSIIVLAIMWLQGKRNEGG